MTNFIFAVENTLNNRLLGAPRRWLEHIVTVWRLPIIVLAVLLLSAGLPLVASTQNLRLLLMFFGGMAGLLICTYRPAIGLLALVITALFAPSPSLPGGLNSAMLLLAALTGLWLLDILFSQGRMRLVRSRPIAPLLVLVAVAILSFGVGQLPWFTLAPPAPLDAQLGGLSVFVLAVAAFLLVAHQVRDLRWLQWMTWLFLAFGALHMAGWLVPGAGKITNRLFQPGTISNSMFWIWPVALAFGQALYNRKLHVLWRLALVGLVAATMYVAFVLNRDWKSGYLPAIVVIAVIIAARSWRLGLVGAIAAVMPTMALAAQAIATDQYSYSTRIDAWKSVLEMIKINPIFGFGPANYYWYTPLFRIRGYAIQFNSHNQYLDIVAQTGILGLVCVLWFAWTLGRSGWRLRNQASEGFAQAYVYGVLGGLAGTLASGMLVDWFLPFVYNIGLSGFRASMLAWLFMGGLVSIEQMARQRSPSPATNSTP
jgi:hypothetical protein